MKLEIASAMGIFLAVLLNASDATAKLPPQNQAEAKQFTDSAQADVNRAVNKANLQTNSGRAAASQAAASSAPGNGHLGSVNLAGAAAQEAQKASQERINGLHESINDINSQQRDLEATLKATEDNHAAAVRAYNDCLAYAGSNCLEVDENGYKGAVAAIQKQGSDFTAQIADLNNQISVEQLRQDFYSQTQSQIQAQTEAIYGTDFSSCTGRGGNCAQGALYAVPQQLPQFPSQDAQVDDGRSLPGVDAKPEPLKQPGATDPKDSGTDRSPGKSRGAGGGAGGGGGGGGGSAKNDSPSSSSPSKSAGSGSGMLDGLKSLLGLNSNNNSQPTNSAAAPAANSATANSDNCAAFPNSPDCAKQRNPDRPNPAQVAEDPNSKSQAADSANPSASNPRNTKLADSTDSAYSPAKIKELNLGQGSGSASANANLYGQNMGRAATGPDPAQSSYVAPNGPKSHVNRGTYTAQGDPTQTASARNGYGTAAPGAANGRSGIALGRTNTAFLTDPKIRSAEIRRRLAASAGAMRMADLESKRMGNYQRSPAGAMKVVGPDGITDPYHDCWGKVNAGYHRLFGH
ncbi:MAG: hypothetical protein C5B49_04550 [Bdellovibrio sp.]|nr:MAG: hypothetical protein C5B49_04550 [Bdellovibrio sp.]